MLHKIILATLIAFFAISTCFAKNINLYDQPKKNAKVIGTIDSQAGLVPIFSSKEGDWLKVGDPRNDNVGWIKSSDLATDSPSFSFSQHVVDTGKGPRQYIVQFGVPRPLSPEQSEKMFKQIQKQQAVFQKDMQKMFQDIYNANLGWSYPVVVPVAVSPEKSDTMDQNKKATDQK